MTTIAPPPRGPRRRGAIRRWGRRVAAGTLALAASLVAVVYAASELRLRARLLVPAHPLAVADDSAARARGAHLAVTRGCAACHGADLGGRELLRNAAVGRLTAPNLTAGGRGPELADADWERAVRHGVRRDGTPLVLMPAHELAGLADDDLAAIVAYARSLPPSDRVLPPPAPGPLARLLLLTGQLTLLPAERIDHAAPHPGAMPPAPTVAYGAYLAAGCVSCHGPRLEGGPIPGAPGSHPPAADLTRAGLGRWSAADFRRAMREGRRPDGTPLRRPMPLDVGRAMTDVELAALWAYLRTLPPRRDGAR